MQPQKGVTEGWSGGISEVLPVIQNGGPMCYIAAVAMERGPARGIEGDGFRLSLVFISITAEVRL